MARKRMRRRRDPNTPGSLQNGQGHIMQPTMIDGKMVHIRRISTTDEGVLYTHAISERSRNKSNGITKLQNQCLRLRNNNNNNNNATSSPTKRPTPATPTLQGYKSAYLLHNNNNNNNPNSPQKNKPPQHKQYTITPKKRFQSKFLNWCDSHHLSLLNTLATTNPDSHLYRPSMLLFKYINWTFHGTFTQVFLTFLIMYLGIMLFFAWLLLLAGNAQPACIVAAGSSFGVNDTEDVTRFSDAFALSWTTFTTVGYGMIYTAVGSDFQPNGPDEELATEPAQCTWVVFLCTAEAFLGLLYAGMCAAILFGKVNRVQSHANIMFANSVCLQYEEVEDYDEDVEDVIGDVGGGEEDEEATEPSWQDLSQHDNQPNE